MSPLHHLLPPALLCVVLAVPATAQEAPPEPAAPSMLELFARDATAFTALPWQQEALGLSHAQTAALREIADEYQPFIADLYEEIRMLFENVGMLGRPVETDEAFALFYDLARHKAEALTTIHAAAEAMLDVLTPEQRAQWEALLVAAAEMQ